MSIKRLSVFLSLLISACFVSFAQTQQNNIVLYAFDFKIIGSNHWSLIYDNTAANSLALKNHDKYASVQSSPTDYVEAIFNAEKGKKYYIYIRGKADNYEAANPSSDALWVQFNNSVDSAGTPIARIDTDEALMFNGFYYFKNYSWLGGDAGNDNNPHDPHTVIFEKSGPQVIRIQSRQASMRFDSVLISSEQRDIPEPQDKKY